MSRIANVVRLWSKRMYRLPMSIFLRNLVRWTPQVDPVPGYTVVIACMESLAPVVAANLRLCARQAGSGSQLHEIILVFDCPPERVPPVVDEMIREISSTLRIRVIGYGNRQYRVAKAIKWGWAYAWMSWCLGIAASQTKAVLIHDLDALPVTPGLFDLLYDQWSQSGAEFCGIRRYIGSGVTREMGLVTTFEMFLDACHVRQTFRPFDLFNKLMLVEGRVVDFDTTLYAQWRSSRRTVCSINEDQLVHPSQLICNYTDLMANRVNFLDRSHMLPILAYYMYLGGDPGPLTIATPELNNSDARKLTLFGRETYINGITPELWGWMEKQVRRIELAVYGSTRPEIESYLRGFIERAGDARTVGKETGAVAVPDM